VLKPREYVAAALRGLRAGALAGNAATMSHGGRSAAVARTGSAMRGEDALSAGAPAEAEGVLALADDFPEVRKGETACLDGALRIVTSTRRDASGATLSVGLSEPLDDMRVSYTRRGGRPFPVSVLALEDASAPSAFADAAAPLEGQTWTVCIVASEWMETSAPAVGDEIRLCDERRGMAADVRLRVASVVADGERWTLRARPRGAA